ncbi:MAG: right-handed parallel beta-helix repeat-containing protein [Acidobacteriia bacterium]|nr:right-handed parallel beta-helix repeat-containing protein [Terriglobia bacterium]
MSSAFEHTAPDPAVDQARDGVVSNNLVYNITSRGNSAYRNDESSDGIYVDGGTRILIEQNVMHDVDFGKELASEHRDRATSYITARNNLIYHSHTAGVSIGGYAPDPDTPIIASWSTTLFMKMTGRQRAPANSKCSGTWRTMFSRTISCMQDLAAL